MLDEAGDVAAAGQLDRALDRLLWPGIGAPHVRTAVAIATGDSEGKHGQEGDTGKELRHGKSALEVRRALYQSDTPAQKKTRRTDVFRVQSGKAGGGTDSSFFAVSFQTRALQVPLKFLGLMLRRRYF
jgi:hypothetical protein